MPRKELKRYPFHQDEQAPFPLDLTVDFSRLRDELEKLENELSDLEWKKDEKGRCLCPRYYGFRFKYNRKDYGYGAYTTWWTVEGEYDDEALCTGQG